MAAIVPAQPADCNLIDMLGQMLLDSLVGNVHTTTGLTRQPAARIGP